MIEDIENIMEQIPFARKDQFQTLLEKSIHVSSDSSNGEELEFPNLIFKIETFFKGFSPFHNEMGKNRKYDSGVTALMTICETLGIEMDKEECFILFHIRALGKFRLREDKLKKELEALWKSDYKDYFLADSDFSYALKSLMRKKFINYRRGNLHLNPNVLIRYRKAK